VKREPLIIACLNDLAGKTRGKAFPESQFEKRLQRGIGWTPTNAQITCFDTIADSPYGALGDLVLIPDAKTRVEVSLENDRPAEQFVIGDIRETNGEAWECCTRQILKAALGRLEAVAGLHLVSAFEHEFQLKDIACPPGSAYTTSGFRRARDYCETLMALMRDAGLNPDTIMKEYGVDQYEVTMGPTEGVTAADRAVILRELVYLTAERYGHMASFTPLRDPVGVGNGVHIHMSFRDHNGNPATYDPDGKYGLSDTAARFVAGVLKYLDRIVALTAPSAVSYVRLTPHRWSAAFNNLGYRDREASVRICAVSDMSDVSKAAQFNFEFRAGDAAASPYLALAAIIHAGVQGIEEELACPEATQEDLSVLSPDVLAARGIIRLPQSLDEALGKFNGDNIVTGWFPSGFVDVYSKHKVGEMNFLEGKDQAEICAAYGAVY